MNWLEQSVYATLALTPLVPIYCGYLWYISRERRSKPRGKRMSTIPACNCPEDLPTCLKTMLKQHKSINEDAGVDTPPPSDATLNASWWSLVSFSTATRTAVIDSPIAGDELPYVPSAPPENPINHVDSTNL